MAFLVTPWAVIVLMGVVALLLVAWCVRTWLRDRPARWTTPYDRLLERNPTLNAEPFRWSVRARRVRTGWFVALVVAVAVLVVADRPVVATVVPTDDR